jgi:hypothetical protein
MKGFGFSFQAWAHVVNTSVAFGHAVVNTVPTVGTTVVYALSAAPPTTSKRSRGRFGWWRLYARDGSGAIRCLKGCLKVGT